MIVYFQKSSGGRSFNIISVVLHLFWVMEHTECLKKAMDPSPNIHLPTDTHILFISLLWKLIFFRQNTKIIF